MKPSRPLKAIVAHISQGPLSLSLGEPANKKAVSTYGDKGAPFLGTCLSGFRCFRGRNKSGSSGRLNPGIPSQKGSDGFVGSCQSAGNKSYGQHVEDYINHLARFPIRLSPPRPSASSAARGQRLRRLMLELLQRRGVRVVFPQQLLARSEAKRERPGFQDDLQTKALARTCSARIYPTSWRLR